MESQVKISLLDRARRYGLEDLFGDILIPMESISIFKFGKKFERTKKCFPGYIIIQMFLTNQTKHLVKNTPKLTGFVGSSIAPPKLRKKDINRLRFAGREIVSKCIEIDYMPGDKVKVIGGPFSNFHGSISKFRSDKKKVRVLVSIFGRCTPVELDYNQVKPIF